MSDFYVPLAGTGTASAYQVSDPFGYQSAEKLRKDLRLFALGVYGRNQFMGGSATLGLDGSAAGSFDLLPVLPFVLDNSNSQISGATSVVVQVRFFVRVSNSAITVTPRVYDVTSAAAATTSGGAGCTATNSDYSGTNQQQTLALTLATASHSYKPQITISGTPASGYQVWAYALVDVYVNT